MKIGIVLLGVGLAFGAALAAAEEVAPAVHRGATVVGEELVPDLGEVAARDLPVVRAWKPGDPIKDIPRRRYPRDGAFVPEEPAGSDPLLEIQAAYTEAPASVDPLLNFAGQGYTGVNPPDTVGDVGGDYYVQSINGSGGAMVTVYNKTTGALAAGPFAMDGLAAGGSCATGLGDPIVLFDRGADRWVLTEFASSGNHLCVYISTTNNPTGTYCRYDFTTPAFPDYPKYGVWTDAYYVTTNESSPTIYALDRANMMTCGTARAAQSFTVASLSGFSFQTLTPADLDGVTDPPVGTPGILMRHRDTEVHGPSGMPSADQLELWAFHVDWTTPASSTLTALPAISTAEFDSTLCGLTSFSCMSMPGVTQGSGSSLDPLREVVMNRLGYRVLDGQQVLVGNLVTDVGSDQGGVRWFELRNTGSGWSLAQEGTYSPDAVNRWMGAIAMDSAGNILLGYNASNGSVAPSLRYTGRYSTDPAGTMTVAETVLVAGSAANGSNRYGDYAAMSVDPSDDCTFWFTGEYNAASTWSTRVGSVKFSACGTPDFTLSSVPTSREICVGANATYNLTVGSVSGYNTQVTLSTSGNPGSAGFSVNPVTPAGTSTLTISGAAVGTSSFNLIGTATGPNVHQIPLGLTVQPAAPGAPTLTAPINFATNVSATPAFSWSAPAAASTYSIQVATDAAFGTVVASASGLASPAWTSNVALNTSTTYYWRVQATNACGVSLYSSAFAFSTLAAPGDCGIGSTPQQVFLESFDGTVTGWSSAGTGNTWATSGARFHSSPTSYKAVDPATSSDQQLSSPSIALPNQTGLTLQFWNHQTMEHRSSGGCYDGGLVEISTDNGGTWTKLLSASMLTDPYDGALASGNPLSPAPAWCGDPQDWLRSVVDIQAYAGQTVRFRFRLASDTSVSREGWYLDDVKVQACLAGLFSGTFETGDLSPWSAVYP